MAKGKNSKKEPKSQSKQEKLNDVANSQAAGIQGEKRGSNKDASGKNSFK